MLRDALADEYAVATVPHGAAALALTKHHHPAVILLDLRMPIMDGWSFLEQYRRHPNGVSKIVLLSGHPDLAAQAERVGADGYVQKPFDLERIRETIARARRHGALLDQSPSSGSSGHTKRASASRVTPPVRYQR